MADDEKGPSLTDPPKGEPAKVPPAVVDEPKPEPKAEPRFTQAELEAELGKRLERTKITRDKQEEQARKDAVSSALKEQGDFAKLAEQREIDLKDANGKLAEMERIQETSDRYKGALQKHLKSLRKDAPKAILALLDQVDEVKQLDWIAENPEALRKAEPDPIPGTTPRRTTTMTGPGEPGKRLPNPPRPLATL